MIHTLARGLVALSVSALASLGAAACTRTTAPVTRNADDVLVHSSEDREQGDRSASPAPAAKKAVERHSSSRAAMHTRR